MLGAVKLYVHLRFDCNGFLLKKLLFRIEREEEASHFDLDSTRSALTGETASTSTWDASSRINSFRNFLLCYPGMIPVYVKVINLWIPILILG